MCPITHTSYVAIVLAVIASFIFGYLWYGPLFGKTWAQLMGIKMSADKNKKPPVSSLLLTLFGTFLTTWVLAFLLYHSNLACNFGVAFAVWFGFYVPQLFGSVTWEGRPAKLFGLNATYTFLNLQLIAAILTYLR